MYHLAIVLQYMFPGEESNYIVQNDGGDSYIAQWTLDKPKPLDSDIAATVSSTEFKEWYKERLGALVDRDTAKRINKQIHAEVPIEEQIGILREQTAAVVDKLGVKPTVRFALLDSIASTEILAGTDKKEDNE